MGEARDMETSKLTLRSGLMARRVEFSPTEYGRWRKQMGQMGKVFCWRRQENKCPGALGKGDELNTTIESGTKELFLRGWREWEMKKQEKF